MNNDSRWGRRRQRAHSDYHDDLGADYFERRNDAATRQRCLVRELEKLGHSVTLQPAA